MTCDRLHIIVSSQFQWMLLQITFDYPAEYITRVSGKYYQTPTRLVSVTFHTNKKMYGPFVSNTPIINNITTDFNYEIGGTFYGFFGTYTSKEIESIGFYMKPIQAQANRLGLHSSQLNPPSFRWFWGWDGEVILSIYIYVCFVSMRYVKGYISERIACLFIMIWIVKCNWIIVTYELRTFCSSCWFLWFVCLELTPLWLWSLGCFHLEPVL